MAGKAKKTVNPQCRTPMSFGRSPRATTPASIDDANRVFRSPYAYEPVVLCTQVANERSMALARRLGFEEAERFFEHGAEQWLGVRWPNETDAG
jgi:hypothetical protein